jgi:hypothetical protein
MNLTDTNAVNDVVDTTSSSLPNYDDYPNGIASDHSSSLAGPHTQQESAPDDCYDNLSCDATHTSYAPSDYSVPPSAAADVDAMPPPPPGYPASSTNNGSGAVATGANVLTARPPHASLRTTSYPVTAAKFSTVASNPAAIHRNVPSSTFTNTIGTRRSPPSAHAATSAAPIGTAPLSSTLPLQNHPTENAHYLTPSVYSSDMSSPADDAADSIPSMTASSPSEHMVPPAGGSGHNNHGHNIPPKKKCCQLLRRGKWTVEEEAYATKLINEVKSGLLPLTDGTTLRNFLSKLLNCDPMRISKKFVGNNCIGKQVFRRRGADINRLTPEQMRQTALELGE